MHESILPLPTQQGSAQMGRETNDDGWKKNLNWPLAVALVSFTVRKQTNNTVNTARRTTITMGFFCFFFY